MQNMLNHMGDDVKGKTAVVSGSGNVAIYTIEKLIQLGAKPLTASDSAGFIYDPDGIDEEKLSYIKDIKEVRRARISEYLDKFPDAQFHADTRPWGVPCDLAFPCATQNEINLEDARSLTSNGVKAVAEGANMPTELDAMHHFQHQGVIFGPAKAANAGGVGVSGLEQSQNALRISWSHEEVERRLYEMMKSIHANCTRYGEEEDGHINYVNGANIAGFVKVADALIAYGAV
jgi:glutamate dehydrogenase (NADP+)